jgi:hypothetical protein
MALERETIDISNNPDLLRLAEEVRRRNTSTVLRNGDQVVAVVMPVADTGKRKAPRSPFRQPSQADMDAFLAAAGGWKDLVDTEQLKRDIYESRARSGRPPIEL